MATTFTGPARCAGSSRFWRQPLVLRLGAWLTLLGFLPLATGGCNYYRTRPQEPTTATLSQLADHKLFIVHEGSEVWELASPRLEGETLTGTRTAGSDIQRAYLTKLSFQQAGRYHIHDAQTVLNLVHLYISSAPAGADGQVRIPIGTIQRLDIVERDSGRSVASYALGAVGVTVGVLVLVAIIAALTKSSCPFVYASDGQQYQFVGEAYSGAVFAPAERDDYLPLPASAPNARGEYLVKISNELKERQYTNLAELWVAQHDTATQVLLDRQGRPHTLRHLQPARQATSDAGIDRTAQLQGIDQNVFAFNDASPGDAPGRLTLSFARPAGAQRGKLVLHARNSLWLDYLYGKFIEQFGTYYPTWAARQHDPATADNVHWAREQHIPLRVSCHTATGWRLADYVPPVGPLAARDVVVPLEFGPGRGPVQVQLETGFMFWEIDYAALDCSADLPVQLDRCSLQQARNERGADERAALLADDAAYLRQPYPGTEVSLRYQPHLPAPAAGQRRTVFLHTKGYYEHIREFKGLPNVVSLYGFRRPGRFVEFSKETYQQLARPEPALALTAAH